MFVGLGEFDIYLDQSTAFDNKIVSALIQKLHSKYKATFNFEINDQEDISMYVAILSKREGYINQVFEEVLEDCEKKGVGRVENENLTIEYLG